MPQALRIPEFIERVCILFSAALTASNSRFWLSNSEVALPAALRTRIEASWSRKRFSARRRGCAASCSRKSMSSEPAPLERAPARSSAGTTTRSIPFVRAARGSTPQSECVAQQLLLVQRTDPRLLGLLDLDQAPDLCPWCTQAVIDASRRRCQRVLARSTSLEVERCSIRARGVTGFTAHLAGSRPRSRCSSNAVVQPAARSALRVRWYPASREA